MKKTVKEVFEESRQSYQAIYNTKPLNDIVFIGEGRATVTMAGGGRGPMEIDLEELQRDYLLIIISVSSFNVMCQAIPKDGTSTRRLIDVFLDMHKKAPEDSGA